MTDSAAAGWATAISTITLFADDLAATKAFYRTAFDCRFKYEDANSAVFDLGSLQVNLLELEHAPELVEPAVVGGAGAGARALLTITVDDVDATFADLVRRGVAFLNGPLDRPWGVRTAAFADPAGHVWEIAR